MNNVSKEKCIETIKSNKFVLVKIFADWCGPCKILDKILSDIESEYTDIKFISVDIEDCHEKVTSLPTTFFYVNSKLVYTIEGLLSEHSLKDKFKLYFKEEE